MGYPNFRKLPQQSGYKASVRRRTPQNRRQLEPQERFLDQRVLRIVSIIDYREGIDAAALGFGGGLSDRYI